MQTEIATNRCNDQRQDHGRLQLQGVHCADWWVSPRIKNSSKTDHTSPIAIQTMASARSG